ncbi:F0F1 ATP synthase subunit epsilon [Roseospira marina]|uniref:ATP synthase epsilon chain n=1 Tax=Roseospira marina TaxID=140057 RepID=A0A5M6I947_9PROT|nr:F0F1 ATP synthase subunit epsilon [Roseospira marina]KAA5604741.1 F0F1 ATP synthase subunit epsilon [Roseospira marina]MBB4313416.1 F-type H+-transporting ATPase subunit epsilon [Roseospira marina]MBB5086578.1 F-type H+-transporting ATPase subunit epsilon [Roseospira marina]
MAETTEFELVSPAKLVMSEPVEMVVVPGVEGDFGALPRHAPMLSTVRPGVVDIHKGGKVETRLFVAGGFAEVTAERCTVLAEEAFPLDGVTAEQAQARLQSARDDLAEAEGDGAKARAAKAVTVAEALVAAVGA